MTAIKKYWCAREFPLVVGKYTNLVVPIARYGIFLKAIL